MLKINVKNETAALRSVVLGTAMDFGGTPTIQQAYDPKSKENIRKGTFPKESDLAEEMEGFEAVLIKHNVEVFRPQIISNCNQIFTRDISFAVDNKFVKPNILKKRIREQDGIAYIMQQIHSDDLIYAPENTRMEGGDVMPWNEYLFVGYSEDDDFSNYEVSRTNRAGLDFLKSTFSDREVIGFELNKSDTDPMENALHLDCCFQPIGLNQAIIYKGGFKNEKDYNFLINYFGKKNVIEIDKVEMYKMNSNLFSISPEVIVSSKGFERINQELKDRGFLVEAIKYDEVAKMEGLFRCSTLPLNRE